LVLQKGREGKCPGVAKQRSGKCNESLNLASYFNAIQLNETERNENASDADRWIAAVSQWKRPVRLILPFGKASFPGSCYFHPPPFPGCLLAKWFVANIYVYLYIYTLYTYRRSYRAGKQLSSSSFLCRASYDYLQWKRFHYKPKPESPSNFPFSPIKWYPLALCTY